MGFLMPKAPAVQKPDPAPTVDDESVRRAAQSAAMRASARRDSLDTNLTGSARRRGGLSQLLRSTVGG